MIRALILCLIAVCSLTTAPVGAQTSASGWIKVATTTINATSSGSKTLDLPDVTFSALRLQADKAVAISAIKTSGGGSFKASGGPLTMSPAQPSAPFYKTASPGGLKQVELTWDAQPNVGTVRIEIWASTGQQAEGRGRTGSPRETAEFEAKRSPPPPPTSVRGIGATPPPPPPPAPAQAPTPPSRDLGSAQPPGAAKDAVPPRRSITQPAKPVAPAAEAPPEELETVDKSAGLPPMGGAPKAKPPLPPVVASVDPSKPNVCTGTGGVKDCTMVDIYFGTDRKPVPNPDRVAFGGERFRKLQLGHAYVTIPNAKRKRGEIPLPGTLQKMLGLVPPGGDPKQHFTIPKGGVTLYATEDEFIAAAKAHAANAGMYKDHAFIFVHGFAVTFDNALFRTAQMTYDLSSDGTPFGTAFMYSWPSIGSADPISYVADGDSARFAINDLTKFIRMVVDKTGVKNVHLIAHSMGNVVLTGALQEIARDNKAPVINQVILAAPDVDKEEFERIVANVGKVAKGLTLYASQGDRALVASRRFHNNQPRAGETLVPPGPAVAKGIDTIDVTAISTDAFWGHDKYADSAEVLSDIAAVFIKGEPPPKRSPKFRLGTLKYWIYDK